MKIGIILGTKEPEVKFNAFRFRTLALRNGHRVWVFLVNNGVDVEDIESISFNVREQVFLFTKKRGEIYACATSMKVHNRKETEVCRPHLRRIC
jgi:peroxiredoxin family protein